MNFTGNIYNDIIDLMRNRLFKNRKIIITLERSLKTHLKIQLRINPNENNLSRIWVVKKNEKIIAYFAISMNAIELDILSNDEKVHNTTTKKYPAMLLGRMGVDKKYRGNGVGAGINQFCEGLAKTTNKKIACRYIVLQTTLDKVNFYKQAKFIKSEKKPRNGLVWMYRHLS